MSEIKACPLLGCSFSMQPALLRGYPPIISAHLNPCVGDKCINFVWDVNEGYCRCFEKYTGHEKEGKHE